MSPAYVAVRMKAWFSIIFSIWKYGDFHIACRSLKTSPNNHANLCSKNDGRDSLKKRFLFFLSVVGTSDYPVAFSISAYSLDKVTGLNCRTEHIEVLSKSTQMQLQVTHICAFIKNSVRVYCKITPG